MLKDKIILIFLIIVVLFTFTQCCSSKEKIKIKNNMEQKIHYPKILSYGVIDLTGSIVEIIQEKNSMYCILKVKKVHGYGSGARPISEDVNYKMIIDKSLLQQIKSDEDSSKLIRCKVVYSPSRMWQENENRIKIISVDKK